MALVPLPYWSLEYTFRDNNGNQATTGINLPASVPYADVASNAVALAAFLDAASDAVLIRYSISTGFNEDAAPVAPTTSEVERKLVIPLNTALRQGAARLEVPSPIFGIEVAGTDVVDVTNPAVADLLGYLVNGDVGLGNGPVTYYGADIISTGTPIIRHRGRAPRR